jgi:hypothetical protein
MSILYIIILVIILVALSVIEIFLSKNKVKWLGLILPLISFIFALVFGCGRVISDLEANIGIILKDFVLLFAFNIPTAIFLIIYFNCRKKIDKS